MDEMSAHLAAAAADLTPGDIVLDPFCGTGSLLIACGHFQAQLVGSDVDVDSLGMLADAATLPLYKRSKNSKIHRKVLLSADDDEFSIDSTGCNVEKGYKSQRQLNLDTFSNFDEYGLQEHVCGLLAVDVAQWAQSEMNDVLVQAKRYRKQEGGLWSKELTEVNLRTNFRQVRHMTYDI